MRRIVYIALLVGLSAVAAHAGARRELSDSFVLDGANELRVEFDIGEVVIETADIDRVEVELDLRCRSSSAVCERRLEGVELIDERRGERLIIRVDGVKKSTANRLSMDAVVRLPRDLELSVEMGIGELDITGTRGDVFVDMGIGEVRLWLEEEAVGAVFLDAGIGESRLYGDATDVDSSRRFLIGSELAWEGGEGEAEVVVDLGIGEVSVHLD